jgi:hypothetical protein
MNGTSGFQEVQVFTPRSQSYRYRFRTRNGIASEHRLMCDVVQVGNRYTL